MTRTETLIDRKDEDQKESGLNGATANAAAHGLKQRASIFAKLIYPASLLASMSIWLLAIRAPLWLDETLAYWQVSGGFAKVWTRSALMPSSLGYLYTLWLAKSRVSKFTSTRSLFPGCTSPG